MFLPPSTRTPKIVPKCTKLHFEISRATSSFFRNISSSQSAGCKEKNIFLSLRPCDCRLASFPHVPLELRKSSRALANRIAHWRNARRRSRIWTRSPSCSCALRGRTALRADTSDFYHRRGLRQRPIIASELLILHRRRDGGHSRGTADGCRWQPTRRHSRRHALASVIGMRLVRSAHAAAQRPLRADEVVAAAPPCGDKAATAQNSGVRCGGGDATAERQRGGGEAVAV